MATRDILVLNTTASRAETQQGSDTVIIKGDSGQALSVENSSGASILSVNTLSSSVDVAGKITATGNISSSLSSTGSFGRLVAKTLIGDAFNLSNTEILGTISSSGQIANQISGSFRLGFEFDGTIGSVANHKTTASFDRIVATTFSGSAANLSRTTLAGTISSSAQIASQISGAFQSGFEFDGTIKKGLGTWTATNPINTARQQVTAFGSQNATVLAGGNNAPRNESETWDGTNWSEGNNLNTGRYGLASAGTATSGLVFGGNPAVADTETYNGTNYSEVNNMVQGRYGVGGWGTQTSAIAVGGAVSEYNNICALTEEWNGTNWSEVNDLNNARWYMGTAGDSSESGIVFGGSYASPAFAVGISTTEQWNGSSWSEVNDLNVNLLYTRGQGSTNNAIAAGGLINSPTNTFSKCTETWDGTSWSVEASLNVAGRYLGIGGNGHGAIAAGFSVEASPYAATNSELFQAAFTTASFGRVDATTLVGDVSQMSNLVKSGLVSGSAQIASQISGSFNKGFEFDGHISGSALTTASFANVFARKAVGDISGMYNLYPKDVVTGAGDIATQISRSFAHTGFEFTGTISGSATSTGSFDNIFAKTIHGDISNLTGIFSGVLSGSKQIASQISGSFNKGFEFDGTIQTSPAAWSLGVAYPYENSNIGGVAVGQSPNAMLAHYGTAGDVFNGSSWSEITAAPSPTTYGIATGDYDAALMVGGNRSGSISWNGSNWSEEASTNRANTYLASGAGTTEAALIFGGGSGSNDSIGHVSAQTEMYDGSSWSEVNDMLIPKYKGSQTGIGSSNSTISYGGCGQAKTYDPPSPFSEFAIGDPRQEGTHLEEWDGSTWTYLGDFYAHPQPSFFNHSGAGVGTTNAASFYGGYTHHFGGGGMNSTHYHWDGTAMSNGVSMLIPKTNNDGAGQGGASGAHSSIFAWYSGYGGSHPTYGAAAIGAHEQYEVFYSTGSFNRLEVKTLTGDGSNLTGTALAGTISSSAQISSSISGSFTSGFTVGGDITNVQPTFAYTATTNVTSARWRGASGIQNAGLAFGGMTPTRISDTETFDGTTWTEVNNLNSVGTTVGGGTTNATVAFGGWYRGACTETWDGTSWSEVNDLITDRGTYTGPIKMSHSQNAALAAGGTPAAYPSDITEEWNGTNWSTSNSIIKKMTCADGFGTPAGGVAIGTAWPATPFTTNNAVLWNGVNWSEGPLLPPSGDFVRMTNMGTAGAENDGIVAGQCQYQAGAFKAGTTCYNGISFSLGNDLPSGCAFHRGAGTSVANAFFVGGQYPSSPYYCNNGFTVSSGVASASFSHIDALRVSASVDQMTNIPEPSGMITGSAQIASYVSGSFNKGFEFGGEIRSLGVWSAGGDFPGHTNSTQHSAVYGTQNAAILAGGMGYYQPSKADTYSYNGTSWSDTGANMIEGRGGYTGIGTADAALAAGGNPYKSHIFQYLRSFTEEWNGSAWSENTNLPHQLTFLNHQKAGTQNAAFIAGGFTGTGGNNVGSGSEAFQQTSLAWDGLSYTTVGCMANERASGGVVGSINSALAQGANNSLGHSTCTEEWNGSAWSDAAASNFPTSFTSTVGTSNNAMHVLDANNPVKAACTDFYNGMSWSTGPLAGLSSPTTYKQCTGAAGSTSAGLFQTFNSSCVEHFDENHATSSIGRVDATELSLESDTNLTVNESLQIPLYATNPPVTSSAGEVWYNTAEEKLYFTYDVNSWTEVADSNHAHSFGGYGGGIGDGIVWAGGGPGPAYTAKSEVWDGNTWTEVADLNTAGTYVPGAGSSNAAIAAGRNNPGFQSCTEIWNGTSWTEANDGAHGQGFTYTGTVNAGVTTGGRNPGNSQPDGVTKEWNGTNWYAGGSQITNKADQTAFVGTQNAAKHMGGGGGAFAAPHYITDLVEDYNGTSFSTATSLPYCVMRTSGGGTQNAAILAGGYSNNDTTTDETYEWNGTSFHQTANLGTGRNTNDIADGSQSSFQVSGGGPFANTTQKKTEQYTTTGIGCHCIGGV